MQGADEVVVALPVLVVNRGALLDDFQQGRRVQRLVRLAEVKDAFHQVDEVAAVSARQFNEGGARFRGERAACAGEGIPPAQ